MIIYEFKCKGKEKQYRAIDETIRTSQFIQNKCLRYWMDNKKIGRYDLNKYCAVLAQEFPFADELNSMARQSAAERSWSAISRFYDNCKKKIKGKKGFPKFKKNCRSVEYKTSGWQLSPNRKAITFRDKKGIGTLKLKGTYDLNYYDIKQIKRVRLVRRADGYYAQFAIDEAARCGGSPRCSDCRVDVRIETQPTKKAVGLDLGLNHFIADSNGNLELSPKFYRKAEKQLNRANRKKSKKFSKERKKAKARQSNNYRKARNRYARKHLKVSRQRKEYCKKLAYSVVHSNDVIVYEDLNVKGMIKNRHLSKSISDAGWSTFRQWLEYFGYKYGKITIAVPPYNTSQNCSNCGKKVKKSLSTRTHVCGHCNYVEDRDINASINILRLGLSTLGHSGTHAWGETPSWAIGVNLSSNGDSLNQESPEF
ncbi:transposase [Nostoc sp. CENA543]|uniref:RNA-guided endonuclease InsQ/TnpB family protein n=1 Tax=Nostoc sp. CENA543 TaxID=1869241 RepID=UPI000CA263CC|nr:RNA-guided endonuclease TnpB family protein [Nostoc sp. CENA543]AUT01063.1 transposase [Nostoc sp. CENA543]